MASFVFFIYAIFFKDDLGVLLHFALAFLVLLGVLDTLPCLGSLWILPHPSIFTIPDHLFGLDPGHSSGVSVDDGVTGLKLQQLWCGYLCKYGPCAGR